MRSLMEVNAKNIEIINLLGIKITECSSDNYGNIKTIRIEDRNGRILNIGRGQYSDSIVLSVEEPPKKAKVFYLTGTVLSGAVDVNKMFASKEQAEKVKESIVDDTADLKIEEKEIENSQGSAV